jgi:hypothetical protein
LAVALSLGCNTLLDIDHVEFGDATLTGQGGGATSAGAGATHGGEQCNNMIDDNGDGAIDCADPNCSTFGCVPAPPDGWEGPSQLWLGNPSERPPSCAGSWTAEQPLFVGLVAPEASCSDCSCGDPSGGSCGLPDMDLLDTDDCDTFEATLGPTMANGCDNFSCSDDQGCGLEGESVPINGGSGCSASGGDATLPAVGWSQAAVLCKSSPGGGCGDDSCAPQPDSGFVGPCIHQLGETSCPPSHPSEIVAHADYDDERGCTACECGAPSGGCLGTTQIFDGSGCPGLPIETVVHNGSSCTGWVPTQLAHSFKYVPGGGNPGNGSCPSSGGDPSGGVAPTSAMTICCAID